MPLTFGQIQEEGLIEIMPKHESSSGDGDTNIHAFGRESNTSLPSPNDKAEDATDHKVVSLSCANSSESHWLQAVAAAQIDGLANSDDDGLDRRDTLWGTATSLPLLCNFWLTDEGAKVDFYGDPYALPSSTAAEQLLGSYMSSVHDSFPILNGMLFQGQVRQHFAASRGDIATRLCPKWQAILNLVFSIGAKHLDISDAALGTGQYDHVLYQSRALALGFSPNTMVQPANILHIQGSGLLALYLISVGQIDRYVNLLPTTTIDSSLAFRAWSALGVAVRAAYTLNLHLSDNDSNEERKASVNVWWSLFSLEQMLSVTTGRTGSIDLSRCSVPLPSVPPKQHLANEVAIPYPMRRGSASFNTATSHHPTETDSW